MARARDQNEVKRGEVAQDMFEEGVRKGSIPGGEPGKRYSSEEAARARQNIMINEYNMSGDGKARPYTTLRNKVIQNWDEIKDLRTKPGKKNK